MAVKQGGGIANKSNKQGKATTPQFWRGSKELQCRNGTIASHKLPGKSSLNVSFVCPACPGEGKCFNIDSAGPTRNSESESENEMRFQCKRQKTL